MRTKNINENKEYIIVEIIPTALNPEKGPIAQISALKLKGLNLIDRFDYRLSENLIYNKDILKMISYDKESFTYLDDGYEILNEFKNWTNNLELLILDNEYTNNYLKDFTNKKESVLSYLGLKLTDDVIDKIIEKYNLEQSNHIVDILYEGLIYQSNKKRS